MWYHGSNQTIDTFRIDPEVQGSSTRSFSAQGAVYFTACPELAFAYARMAARQLYPFDHHATVAHLEGLSHRYNALMDQGQFDAAESVCEQLEAEEGALTGVTAGEVIYPVHLVTDKTLEVDFQGGQWAGDRVTQLMTLAQSRELDALVLRNVVDQPDMGVHTPTDICVVFNAAIIHPALSVDPALHAQHQHAVPPVKPEDRPETHDSGMTAYP